MAVQLEKQRSVRTHSRANEIAALLVLALAVLGFLLVITYTPDDPSANGTGYLPGKRQNLIGLVGAYSADILFQTIGYAAYIFPAILGLIAWRVFHSESLRPRVGKVIGLALFVISLSSLLELGGAWGGVVGTFFAQILTYLLSGIGAGILLTATFFASLIVVTEFSFFGFFSNFELAWANFRIRFDEWLAKRRKKREILKAEVQRQAERAPAERADKSVKAAPSVSLGDLRAKSDSGNENGAEKSAENKSLADILRESALKLRDKTRVGAKVPAQATASDNSEPPESAAEPEAEVFPPTIRITERFEPEPSVRQTSAANEETHQSLDDLLRGEESIPITPIQHTGELTDEMLGETADEREEIAPAPVKKPQNYDDYILPTPDFLTPPTARIEQKDDELLSIAQELTEKTKEFNVTGRVVHICQGPVVTTYEFKPDPGVKYSRVTGLVDDLCLALKAESIRIDRIPGKAFVGIEVPNHQRETIQLREVIESKKFKDSNSMLSIALGKSIDGLNYVADLSKMPHLLMAGQTGAGKSVGVNSLIISILYKAKPDEVKFIMVDPKQVELGIYADIPHLATPIIKDPKRASVALKWAVSEMEKRYKNLAAWGVRNLDGYNAEVKRRNAEEMLDDNGDKWKNLPYIVIIIDELADLMMVAGKEVEESITRLAQMARAVGIHLVLATQRPSVDVITGLIKANFPARMSFRVSSKVDSRTIIDGNGAESLLGKGDMLFLPPGTSNLVRVHGAFVDEKEIHKIVEHIKAQGNPEYDTTITKTEDELDTDGDLPGKRDPLFWDALKTVVRNKGASTSLLQRHLRIGYGRAAAILDAMVRENYIGEMEGSKRARPILQKAYDDLQDVEEMNGGEI